MTDHPHPVLVGIDGTASGLEAVDLGGALAVLTGSPVVLGAVYAASSEAWPTRAMAEQALTEAQTRLGDFIPRTAVAVPATSPAHGLSNLARAQNARLIVLGSSRRGPVGRVPWLLRRRDHASAVEASLIALHAALYLTAVLWVLSPLKALAFVVVQHAVFSLYLGISFAPNDKGMLRIIESATRQAVPAARGGHRPKYQRRPVYYLRALGGLNYQIEHHLFPSMPRPNLRRVQGLVRDFCASTDLGYREESFTGSFRQIVHHLSAAGTAASRRPD